MPFARPQLDDTLSAVNFAIKSNYPARGYYVTNLLSDNQIKGLTWLNYSKPKYDTEKNCKAEGTQGYDLTNEQLDGANIKFNAIKAIR